jgi:hypothetical protein
MKSFSLLFFILSTTAFAAPLAPPSLYVNIGTCSAEGRPDASFKVMVDGNTADQVGPSKGLLIFKDIEDPGDPNEILTLAMDTTLEKQDDGSFLFENTLVTEPGSNEKILLKPGQETKSTVGKFTFLCKGKAM